MRRNYAQESYEPNKRSSHIRFLGRHLTLTMTEEGLMIRLYFVPLVFLGVAHAVIAGPDQQERAIDTPRSSLTVHVRKAGLLSAAAHEHWVNAPITSGSVDDSSAAPGIRFTCRCAEAFSQP
jgi:hypothetical protein